MPLPTRISRNNLHHHEVRVRLRPGQRLSLHFKKRSITMDDPYAAPLGAVLVYGDRNRGHVEIRTNDGFVTDITRSTHVLIDWSRFRGSFLPEIIREREF
ncbi:MAG: hypothetical protein DMF25_04690 [Verrucomicrobia bacterium]|nr:MAG: hypothetical protein DMF25_04690 [Verrucomicrobiota bacterium]